MRWLEGTTAPTGSRLVLLDGVPLEAPLTGTTLLFENNDQPGVVGTLGTVLARHGINIAKFSLGRTETGNAVGAVQLDEPAPIPKEILSEIRALKQLKAAWLVRV
jgi:D-3-phosphoglycerate dehydrogenase